MGGAMRFMAHRFLKETEQARAVSQATLRQILALNGEAEWGRTRGLNGPKALDAFRSLPLTTYQDYVPYIKRVAAGEQGVLTSEPVTYFAVTSGTTGPQKLIPVTPRQTSTIMRNMLVPMGLAMKSGLLGPMRGRWLQIMTEQINGTTPGGIPKGAATSGGMQKMGKMAELIWTSPLSVVKIQDQMTARYLHLLFALGEERLWAMVAFFPSTLLFAFRDLQARAPQLLRDLADGTITNDIDLPAALRSELAGALKPNPVRARHLASLLERDRFTVREIWPQLGTVMTAGSGTFRFYIDQLQPYLGGVPVFSPVYASSEAAIGVGLSLDQPGYAISPASAYFEFVPADESDEANPTVLPLEGVRPDQEYELVLTNFAGLYRYRLGDMVKVLGFQGESPIVEFLRRKGQVINIVGEKASEPQIAPAFEAACREVGAAVLDYVVTPDANSTPTRYLLLVEELTPCDPQRLLEAFEQHLRRLAPDYSWHRNLGDLGPMAAHLLQSGAFERYRDARVAAGASAAQVKIPHVAPDPAFTERHFTNEIRQTIQQRG